MSATTPIRVVLADDHQLFRSGLHQLLELEPDIEVVGEATNGIEALKVLGTCRPHVLLLDLSMPMLDGFGTLEAVRRDFPSVAVLILTMHSEEAIILRALDAGANGLIRKDADSSEVINAIRCVTAGQAWVEPRAAAVLLNEYRRLRAIAGPAGTGRLSERDVALLRLIAGGYSNKEIASSLGVAESTVKNQLSSLFDRLGVSDRTQAALYAFAHGILAPQPPAQ